MENLFGKTLRELQDIVKSVGLPGFTAKQIADWIYKKDATDFEQMTNLSAKNRALLAENYTIGLTSPTKEMCSTDGTKKYLYPAHSNLFIETAYIPDRDRATLCVSTQVGCKMGCLFCMTARQGFQSNLTAGEILNQFRSLPERDKITNIVYMGMGEPLDNVNEVLKSLELFTEEYAYGLGHKRITVSSVGIVPPMRQFLETNKCHLAISLHSPFDDERKTIMPVANVYSIEEVLETIREFDLGKQRRISFEYIIFKGINDSMAHVRELSRILNGINCRMNLIRFHQIPGSPLEGVDQAAMERFRDALNDKGITATVRASRGEDIYAACGMLSTKEIVKKQSNNA